MTDTTNEIICEECKHSSEFHTMWGCRKCSETGKMCRTAKGGVLGQDENSDPRTTIANLRVRLSALQTEVEGRGRKIEQALVSLESIGLIAIAKCHVCAGPCNHDAFFQDIALIAQTARALLAATAPVEGETPNKEDEK